MTDDICVVVTTIRRFPRNMAAEAIDHALTARGEGKRSEIMSSERSRQLYQPVMQDLREYAAYLGVEFPR